MPEVQPGLPYNRNPLLSHDVPFASFEAHSLPGYHQPGVLCCAGTGCPEYPSCRKTRPGHQPHGSCLSRACPTSSKSGTCCGRQSSRRCEYRRGRGHLVTLLADRAARTHTPCRSVTGALRTTSTIYPEMAGGNCTCATLQDALYLRLIFFIVTGALARAPRVQWGGRRSRQKFDHIVADLVKNAREQWSEGNDLHIDTLDVYFMEVCVAAAGGTMEHGCDKNGATLYFLEATHGH